MVCLSFQNWLTPVLSTFLHHWCFLEFWSWPALCLDFLPCSTTFLICSVQDWTQESLAKALLVACFIKAHSCELLPCCDPCHPQILLQRAVSTLRLCIWISLNASPHSCPCWWHSGFLTLSLWFATIIWTSQPLPQPASCHQQLVSLITVPHPTTGVITSNINSTRALESPTFCFGDD